MTAIENGGTTNTVMKRMRELENRLNELEKQIAIEKSKTAVMLNKDQIKRVLHASVSVRAETLNKLPCKANNIV